MQKKQNRQLPLCAGNIRTYAESKKFVSHSQILFGQSQIEMCTGRAARGLGRVGPFDCGWQIFLIQHSVRISSAKWQLSVLLLLHEL